MIARIAGTANKMASLADKVQRRNKNRCENETKKNCSNKQTSEKGTRESTVSSEKFETSQCKRKVLKRCPTVNQTGLFLFTAHFMERHVVGAERVRACCDLQDCGLVACRVPQVAKLLLNWADSE